MIVSEKLIMRSHMTTNREKVSSNKPSFQIEVKRKLVANYTAISTLLVIRKLIEMTTH